MTALETDWVFLREALPLLRDYVLSRDVYRPVPQLVRLNAPQLSIGSVQISLARLAAVAWNGKAKADLEGLRQQAQQVRDEWRANWGSKAAKEFESRLNLWGAYIRELRAGPREYAASYASEVRQRVILRLLLSELNGGLPPNQAGALAQLDQSLRGITRPGSFIWEAEVQASFPVDDFWFLYVTF